MQFILFLFYVVGISFSGVASPGPLTLLTISSSYNNKSAGVLISLGHAIVEVPLVLLISFGMIKFLNSEIFKIKISLLGGIVLILLGVASVKNINNTEKATYKVKPSLLFSGSLATVSNPYFFIWWTTIGTALIIQALNFGKLGFIVFLVVHLMCDFLWYTSVSKIVYRTKKVISEKVLTIISKICGSILVIFGLVFITNTLKILIR